MKLSRVPTKIADLGKSCPTESLASAGLIVVIGILIVGLIGIPEWRYFFGATVVVGGLVAYALRHRHSEP
jgi:hypothetical protein